MQNDCRFGFGPGGATGPPDLSVESGTRHTEEPVQGVLSGVARRPGARRVPTMFDSIRYLLLQIRNPDDPMRAHEVRCFCRGLQARPDQIEVVDLLTERPSDVHFQKRDVVLLGGSGHYSVAGEGEWLERSLDVLREVHARRQPTFASCWGFQAMARALGGRVVHDTARAEIGTHTLQLTGEGRADPVFGSLSQTFAGQMGHEDCVVELPPGATLLASSDKVANQAYRFEEAPIYCTQFHPELNRSDLLLRLEAYPEYIQHLTSMTPEEFAAGVYDTPETEALLPHFVRHVLS
jgi:GMP synthase (glutamine-hydrolysing)